jgi:CDGSH-type Zn-finger protein
MTGERTGDVSRHRITISIKRHGPYLISLEQAEMVRILDADGNVVEPEPGKPIALCRCGQSQHKPFCDRTHKSCGFDGSLAVAPTPRPTGSME